MRMSLTRSSLLLACSLTLVCATGLSAQDEPPPGLAAGAGAHMAHPIKTNDMVNMHGMHTMPATVTGVDPKTGIVDVMAEGMALRVHFPPASMAGLKAGDKIGLYMGYSQANVVK